ncbi:hypothetical protein C7M84_019501 [Penaeus vannamei]|uniref:Uncharacterized protein n=1 Tax=Penaeus vannamei TaxID=6689 RepID=A0A423SEJ5_PENVA|nr:hypothetical protein C7M84_019501 [Penaeus vannamei]
MILCDVGRSPRHKFRFHETKCTEQPADFTTAWPVSAPSSLFGEFSCVYEYIGGNRLRRTAGARAVLEQPAKGTRRVGELHDFADPSKLLHAQQLPRFICGSKTTASRTEEVGARSLPRASRKRGDFPPRPSPSHPSPPHCFPSLSVLPFFSLSLFLPFFLPSAPPPISSLLPLPLILFPPCLSPFSPLSVSLFFHDVLPLSPHFPHSPLPYSSLPTFISSPPLPLPSLSSSHPLSLPPSSPPLTLTYPSLSPCSFPPSSLYTLLPLSSLPSSPLSPSSLLPLPLPSPLSFSPSLPPPLPSPLSFSPLLTPLFPLPFPSPPLPSPPSLPPSPPLPLSNPFPLPSPPSSKNLQIIRKRFLAYCPLSHCDRRRSRDLPMVSIIRNALSARHSCTVCNGLAPPCILPLIFLFFLSSFFDKDRRGMEERGKEERGKKNKGRRWMKGRGRKRE